MEADETAAYEDAQAFAHFIATRVGPPLRAADLTEPLGEAFSAFYSAVPARRTAVVRELMLQTSTDAPDEIDLLRQVTRGVLRDIDATPAAAARLELALEEVRAFPDQRGAEAVRPGRRPVPPATCELTFDLVSSAPALVRAVPALEALPNPLPAPGLGARSRRGVRRTAQRH